MIKYPPIHHYLLPHEIDTVVKEGTTRQRSGYLCNKILKTQVRNFYRSLLI